MRSIVVFLLISFFFTSIMEGQRLFNPSFEGEPIDATMPDSWHACQDGTTPDILPGPWGVDIEPYDGQSYVGLITRSDGTWEAVGQQFSESITKDLCYNMTITAAHADTYSGYNRQGRLRVWLGNSKCDLGQLILDVESLMHSDWKTYPIRFKSNDDYNYLIIESYFTQPSQRVNGNILIDRITLPVSCGRA